MSQNHLHFLYMGWGYIYKEVNHTIIHTKKDLLCCMIHKWYYFRIGNMFSYKGWVLCNLLNMHNRKTPRVRWISTEYLISTDWFKLRRIYQKLMEYYSTIKCMIQLTRQIQWLHYINLIEETYVYVFNTFIQSIIQCLYLQHYPVDPLNLSCF